MLTGRSFEIITSAAASMGELKNFTHKLVRYVEERLASNTCVMAIISWFIQKPFSDKTVDQVVKLL
jgi:hypothetical protein